MKVNGLSSYRLGFYFLIGFAALLALIAVLTEEPRWYLESPLLMLSASSVIGGIFLFALDENKVIDARLASRLSMQGIPALGHTIRDLGGHGTAIFLPPATEGGAVMQFIPTRFAGEPLQRDGGGLTYHQGSMGALSSPLASPIIEDLKRDNDLILPSEYNLLMRAICEVCEDVLSIANRVEIRREGDVVTFDLHNYLLRPGCASLREASPGLCVLCPCSICSLIACMIAEGLKCEISLDKVTQDDTGQTPIMSISYTLKRDARVQVPD